MPTMTTPVATTWQRSSHISLCFDRCTTRRRRQRHVTLASCTAEAVTRPVYQAPVSHPDGLGPSTSTTHQSHELIHTPAHRHISSQGLRCAVGSFCAQQLWCISVPDAAHAADSLSPSGVELFQQLLVRIECVAFALCMMLLACALLSCGACFLPCLQHQVDSLGPWGGVLFVVVVMTAEMVPLLPTQPLSLASGLLFGPQKVGMHIHVL